jgi:L-fucose isomerase-like protein
LRIGFINICHTDYLNNAVTQMAETAVQNLRDNDIDIYEASIPASDYNNAYLAGLEMASANLDGVILFLGSWTEGSTAMAAIREVEHLPMLLWGFPMFPEGQVMQSTGSYVSFAMMRGSMERAGYRFTGLLGLPDDSSIIRTAVSFCRAAGAKTSLKRNRIGLVGYSSMNIYPGTFDHLLMRTKIGPEIVHFDSYTIIKAAEELTEDQRLKAIEVFKKLGEVNSDVSEESLLKAGGLYAAIKKLCDDESLDALNIKCQYEFSKLYKMVACVPLSALAETGVVTACEGDIMCSVSMQILSLLSGETVTYGDAIHNDNDIIKLSSCGMLPFSLGYGKRRISNFMPHDGFHGIQASYVMRPGKVTVMRLIEDVGSYRMLYFTGEGQETELRQGYMPALDVKPDVNMEKIVQNYSGQHFAICYGDYSDELKQLCTLLDIKAIEL